MLFSLAMICSTVGSVERVLGAEQNTETTFETSNKWEVELTPYFWAAEIDDDATLRGRTGPVISKI